MAANGNQNRKNESIRRANRVIQSRTFVLMLIMGILMFVLLFFRLYDLQITRHEELQGKAVSQQTRRTVVTASRGTIYDASGNILAISASAETIILSPLEIDQAVNSKTTPVSWTKDSLAAGLADILGKDAASIRKRMENTESQYEVIQLRAEEDVAAKVRAYVDENDIVGVHLVADSKRYYPYGSLAAQVIGFVGTENTGLYGLEAYYEEELEGQSGLVISAKDKAENDMLYTYDGKPGMGEGNKGHYSNAEVDALLDQASVETDQAKRAALVEQVDQIARDEAAYIPLFFKDNIFGVRNGIHYTPSADDHILAWDFTF